MVDLFSTNFVNEWTSNLPGQLIDFKIFQHSQWHNIIQSPYIIHNMKINETERDIPSYPVVVSPLLYM